VPIMPPVGGSTGARAPPEQRMFALRPRPPLRAAKGRAESGSAKPNPPKPETGLEPVTPCLQGDLANARQGPESLTLWGSGLDRGRFPVACDGLSASVKTETGSTV
jgi:hypothetical protein